MDTDPPRRQLTVEIDPFLLRRLHLAKVDRDMTLKELVAEALERLLGSFEKEEE